jgi:hypothetical protein
MNHRSASLLILVFFSLLFTRCNNKADRTLSGKEKNDHEPSLSGTYVGEVRYFPETQEFYTPLFLYPGFDESINDSLIAQLDSVVYQRKGMKRSRLPAFFAKTKFMLFDLDTIHIYDTEHVLATTASMVRIEYLQERIENKFIAVYKGEKLHNDPAEEYYCLNRPLPQFHIRDFSHRNLNDPSLNKFLLHKLNEKTSAQWIINNIKLLPSGTVYSVMTSAEKSLITEYKNNEFKVLKELNGNYRIDRILPLPIEMNSRPLLLTTLYIPGLLPRSTSLAVFTNYEEYKILRRNRIQLKQ